MILMFKFALNLKPLMPISVLRFVHFERYSRQLW
jgi:hypothetical protein